MLNHQCVSSPSALKTQDWKMRDWKTRERIVMERRSSLNSRRKLRTQVSDTSKPASLWSNYYQRTSSLYSSCWHTSRPRPRLLARDSRPSVRPLESALECSPDPRPWSLVVAWEQLKYVLSTTIGWQEKGRRLQPVLMTLDPISRACQKITCSCQTCRVKKFRCGCKNATLFCTAICQPYKGKHLC